MGLQYVVAKRVFGFDKTKTAKYVAKSVGSGEMGFDKLCAKVSRILGIHRKVVDLVAVGLVDIMSEEIDDGKTVVLGDFGRFRPSFTGKSADKAEDVSANNIVRKRILFLPGKTFSNMLEDMSVEAVVREYLNAHAPRAMAVVDPLKLTVTNYEGSEETDFEINQLDENAGTRKVKFGKTLYIEKSDFSLDPPPKYFRLKIGGCVRLKNAYIVRADEAVKDENGNVTEVKCTYFPESRSGNDTSGIKAKGVLHWVNAETCVDAELRQYDHLLKDAEYAGQDFSERMNTDSEHIFAAKAEPYLLSATEGEAFQLMRTGYYKKCTENGKLVLSEIVSLKDNFNK